MTRGRAVHTRIEADFANIWASLLNTWAFCEFKRTDKFFSFSCIAIENTDYTPDYTVHAAQIFW